MNGSIQSLKQIPIHNLYSAASLKNVIPFNNTMWCFYEDGNLCIIGTDLIRKHSAFWTSENCTTIKNIVQCDSRIIVSYDNLLVGLTEIPNKEDENL